MPTDRTFFIWSKEHNGWWKRGRMGYSPNISDAGAYSRDQAMEICEKANIMWDGTGQPEEMMVPVQMMLETQPEVRKTRRTVRFGRAYRTMT